MTSDGMKADLRKLDFLVRTMRSHVSICNTGKQDLSYNVSKPTFCPRKRWRTPLCLPTVLQEVEVSGVAHKFLLF